MSQMIDFKKIPGAEDNLHNIAPDIYEHPLLWIPINSNMATYRDVMVDDVYDLVDLERMCASVEHQNANKAYLNFVSEQEQKAAQRSKK